MLAQGAPGEAPGHPLANDACVRLVPGSFAFFGCGLQYDTVVQPIAFMLARRAPDRVRERGIIQERCKSE